jgi:hypothetical protein
MPKLTPASQSASAACAPPERVRRVLAGLPFKGIHRWLFHAACTCVEEALEESQITEILYAATRDARRRVSRREIASACADARRRCGAERHTSWQSIRPVTCTPVPVTNTMRNLLGSVDDLIGGSLLVARSLPVPLEANKGFMPRG